MLSHFHLFGVIKLIDFEPIQSRMNALAQLVHQNCHNSKSDLASNHVHYMFLLGLCEKSTYLLSTILL
jgi:hypothetical protein